MDIVIVRIILAIALVGFFPLFGYWIVSTREKFATNLLLGWTALIGAALIVNWMIP